MIDKEKFIANWDTLKDETKAKILKLADKEIKEDYFVPKKGEIFYVYSYNYMYRTITAVSLSYDNTTFYNSYIILGNCFRTPDEAEFAGKCDYFTKLFETYVNRHTEKVDWNKSNRLKYHVYYSFEDKVITFSSAFIRKEQGTVYASSIEILKDAIEDIGEDNFLKYVMKVEK